MDDEGVNLKIVIGRTNPPHAGHIALMTAAITAAQKAPGPIKCALILLGNGPEGQRTNEDPIDHDTKSAFLRKKLSAVRDDGTSFVDGVDFEVMQMNTSEERGASGNISDFLNRFVTENYPNSISIVQFTGDKPGKISKTGKLGLSDSAKHEGLRLSIQQCIQKKYNQATVTCGYKAVPAEIITGETPMSATKVREDAVACFSTAAAADSATAAADRGHTCWMERYPFYNGDSETVRLSKLMFEAIIHFKDTPYKKTKKPPGTRRVRVCGGDDDDEQDPIRFVKITAAKGGPGGSRRKHTRRKLRNKKTIRTNRRHNKHRHTRKRF